MEQRIASLEEEVKLLKNQIRSVLLDIKENLSSSDWQMAPGQNRGVDSPEEANQLLPESHSINSVKEESVSAAVKTPPPVEKVMYRAEEDTLVREQVYPSAPQNHNGHHGQNGSHNGSGQGETRREQRLEPLTLIMLMQWLERSQATLGAEETGKLLEFYASGQDLSEETRQTLKLLLGLVRKDQDSSKTAAAIPFLLELDDLFRPHNEPASFEKMVVKMMLQNQVNHG